MLRQRRFRIISNRQNMESLAERFNMRMVKRQEASKSTAASKMNKDSDRSSEGNEEVNLVSRNQPENPEKQQTAEKRLRASLTVRRTGSNPPTLTALAENAVIKTSFEE